ncbi:MULTISPECIES: sensor histidine kinase [Giesbergeria]|uniref:histidine kinase n=1 Tax=Giesbergeria sinuosa TaxID=80883 RepID=A0ABV9QF21_9BURK
MRHKLYIIFIFLISLQIPVFAKDFVIERSFLVDPTGTLTIEDVQTLEFKPAPVVLSRGYTESVTWLRLVVDSSALAQLLVVVRPAYLDDVRLYSRTKNTSEASGEWLMRQQGDAFAFNQRERHDLNFSFSIEPSADKPTTIYVRLQTSSTTALFVTVQPTTEAEQFDSLLMLGSGVYVGILFVLILLSLERFSITKDHLWGLNGIFQITTLVMAAAFMGFHAKFALPDNPSLANKSTSIVLVSHFLISSIYSYRFFTVFQGPRINNIFIGCLSFITPFLFWQIANDSVQQAMELNSTMVLLLIALSFIASYKIKVQDKIIRYLIRFNYSFLLLYLLYVMLPVMGWAPMSQLHLYPVIALNLFASIMQYLTLTRRDYLELRNQIQLHEEIEQTQAQLLWEQQRRAESASFMSMLLHELKNPLASIRLATQTLMSGRVMQPKDQLIRINNIYESVDGMNAVLERCRHADRLDQGDWLPQKTPHDVVILLSQWVQEHRLCHRIQIELPENLSAQVEIDLLKIMVMNLIDNALAYSPADSIIQVKLREQPHPVSQFLIAIYNSVGKVGWPDPDRVFTKYYRAQAAHQRTGSGLGLFLVKSIARLYGGDASYRAQEDKVVFELRLPCQ